MAVEIISGASVKIAGTEIGDQVTELEIDDARDENDDTTVSMTAKSMTGGLPTPSVTLTMRWDYASTKSYELIKAALNTSTAVVIRRNGSAIRSGTNPDWEFTGKVLQMPPIAGQAGQFQTPKIKFHPTGTPLSYKTTTT